MRLESGQMIALIIGSELISQLYLTLSEIRINCEILTLRCVYTYRQHAVVRHNPSRAQLSLARHNE